MNTKAYEASYETCTAALRVYNEQVRKYRAGLISDAEYLAARKARDEAMAAYDAAFAAEQAR
jgi:hypothetical protein